MNTNYCEISICETRIKNKYIIFSAIDNLIKGASGQAIQNMNILFKFPEYLGLNETNIIFNINFLTNLQQAKNCFNLRDHICVNKRSRTIF